MSRIPHLAGRVPYSGVTHAPYDLPEYRGGGGVAPVVYTYATWNPLDISADMALSGGDLTVNRVFNPGNWRLGRSTDGKTTGEHQCEIYTSTTTGSDYIIGVCKAGTSVNTFLGSDTNGWGYHGNGSKVNAGGLTAYGSAIGADTYVTIRWNADTGDLEFKRDGVSQGVIATGLTGEVFICISTYLVPQGFTLNTGATPLQYPYAIARQGWYS